VNVNDNAVSEIRNTYLKLLPLKGQIAEFLAAEIALYTVSIDLVIYSTDGY
jgi:hypothetical protein